MSELITKIDATNKPIGRLSTEVAMVLMGKVSPHYKPNTDLGYSVEISNIKEAILTGRKKEQKVYYRHSNYPGGLKKIPAKQLSNKEMLKKAVSRMLPKNSFRKPRLKRLKFI